MKVPAVVLRVLKDVDELQARIKKLGTRITQDYTGKNLVLIGVLKGAFVFLADLSRQIGKEVSVTVDFVRISSYGDQKTSTGTAQILLDISQPIEGKDVIVVEDIIDTGRTIHFLLENLKTRNPASIQVCSLLYKPSRNIVPAKIQYLGFKIPNVFVVGYGMDYRGEYRNLPFVGYLSELEK